MHPNFVIGLNWECLHPTDYVHTPNFTIRHNCGAYTQMSIVHTPNTVRYTTNLAVSHPHACTIPPIHLLPPIWSKWGCNHAPQFCTLPPIWSIGGISQDWGCVDAPNFVTGQNWGCLPPPNSAHAPQFCNWTELGVSAPPRFCTIPPIWPIGAISQDCECDGAESV